MGKRTDSVRPAKKTAHPERASFTATAAPIPIAKNIPSFDQHAL